MPIVSAPILAYPDHSKPFILDTDASDVGIGRSFHKSRATGRKVHVIAYDSRKLSKTRAKVLRNPEGVISCGGVHTSFPTLLVR